MAKFTLDNIRSAAEAKYGDLEIEFGEGRTLRMVNALRLSKDKRATLLNIQKNTDDRDEGDVMRDAIRIVASNDHDAEAFLAVIGEDLSQLATVFEFYSEGTQMGEASASQD